jgi:hypothetical protein
MIKHLCTFAAVCGVYVLGVSGCLATTAAIAKHLDYKGCQEEAKLSLIDDAYCMYRQ